MYGLFALRRTVFRGGVPGARSPEPQRETGLWAWWGIRPFAVPGSGSRGAESLQPRLYLGLWALPGLWHPSQRSLAEFPGALSLCPGQLQPGPGRTPKTLVVFRVSCSGQEDPALHTYFVFLLLMENRRDRLWSNAQEQMWSCPS